MSGNDNTVIVVDGREGVITSWARDTFSFGGLVGSAIALNVLMPPSGWINAALAIAWILWMAGKGASRRMRMTPDEARKWLDDNHAGRATGAANVGEDQ